MAAGRHFAFNEGKGQTKTATRQNIIDEEVARLRFSSSFSMRGWTKVNCHGLFKPPARMKSHPRTTAENNISNYVPDILSPFEGLQCIRRLLKRRLQISESLERWVVLLSNFAPVSKP